MKNVLDRIRERTPEYKKRQSSKSFDLTEAILDILEEKGMSQKDLADRLGKSESEISKWMKGVHNFTLETISKIEEALGQDIFNTHKRWMLGRVRNER